MSIVRLAPGAITDIRRILRRSKAEFGAGAGARYKELLDQSLRDLGEDPNRVGVRSVADIRAGYFVYHLKFSKARAKGQPVRHPRHLMVFSFDSSGNVLVAAVLHEREMLERHLEE